MENNNTNGLGKFEFANINPELLKKVQNLEDELNKENDTSHIILMALNNNVKH